MPSLSLAARRSSLAAPPRRSLLAARRSPDSSTSDRYLPGTQPAGAPATPPRRHERRATRPSSVASTSWSPYGFDLEDHIALANGLSNRHRHSTMTPSSIDCPALGMRMEMTFPAGPPQPIPWSRAFAMDPLCRSAPTTGTLSAGDPPPPNCSSDPATGAVSAPNSAAPA